MDAKGKVQSNAGEIRPLRDPADLHQAIAVKAYYLAASRNFEAGHEMEDWLTAESEILAERESMKGFPA